MFNVDTVPGLELKGLDAPVDAYLVVSERPRGFRLDQLGARRGHRGEHRRPGRRDAVPPGTLPRRRRRGALPRRRHRRVTRASARAGCCATSTPGSRASRRSVWWFRGRASHVEQNRANSLTRDVIATRTGDRRERPAGGRPREARGRVRHGLRGGRGGGTRGARRRRSGSGSTSGPTRRLRGGPDRAPERARPGDRGPGPVLRAAGGLRSRSSSCSRTCTGPTRRRCGSSTTPSGCGATARSWSWPRPAPRCWRSARGGVRASSTTCGSPWGRCPAGRAGRWSSSCSRRSTTRRWSSSTWSSTRARETRSTSRSWSPG